MRNVRIRKNVKTFCHLKWRAEEAEAKTHDRHPPTHAPPCGGSFSSRQSTRAFHLPPSKFNVEVHEDVVSFDADEDSIFSQEGNCWPEEQEEYRDKLTPLKSSLRSSQKTQVDDSLKDSGRLRREAPEMEDDKENISENGGGGSKRGFVASTGAVHRGGIITFGNRLQISCKGPEHVLRFKG